MSSDTPVMQQYKRIKSRYPNTILFFRMGDFYEMFEKDAKEVSALLDIVLTKRHGIPMCGIPYHAASSYIARLLKTGRKIALCEQLSTTPAKGAKIVEREVTEVITPGTIVNEDYLDNNKNNYLAAIGKHSNYIAASFVDISTGEFYAFSFPHEKGSYEETLYRELVKTSPSEIIIQESLLEEDAGIEKVILEIGNVVINRYPDWYFNIDNGIEILKKHFDIATLKGFGFEDTDPEIVCAGILVEYLKENAGALLPHINSLEKITKNVSVEIDGKALKNLEIIKNMSDGSSKYTLISTVDYTGTSMGSRMLKKWLQNPLQDKIMIDKRLNNVDFFYKNQLVLTKLRSYFSSLNDIERFTSRLALDKVNAKDLLGLKNNIAGFLQIAEIIWEYKSKTLFEYFPHKKDITKAASVVEILEKTILSNPPVIITEGEMIKNGYCGELDKLRNIRDNSKEILEKYIEKEKEMSGISTLRIRYNKIIGYFIEITKSHLEKIPSHFIRRQSLVGSERFTTEKLAELEIDLISAAEKIFALEKNIFIEIRDSLKPHISLFRKIANVIGETDCLQSFAYAATARGFTKPEVNNSSAIIIKNGRHPVVEASLPAGEFIPNDIVLDKKKNFILLTGPNMAGKSTFLRQSALITLLAQAGSFVPADSAEIGIVDKIFCRVGSSDNLARGESTFLVEMSEASYILRNATEKSLIIMDEVGRGTGTNDGLSIARSICEYIITKLKAKTLFATHYHELISMEMPEIENLSMNAIESEGKLVFLKKIKKGAANKSYGINVAGMAGIPYSVIVRAEELLEYYDSKSHMKNNQVEKIDKQNTLFPEEYIISKEIEAVDINNTTPIEAINYIISWQKKMK